jgi:hypothetical protein
MQRTEEFVDDRQKSWCIHCARSLAGLDTNDDHVPSKSLLSKPRPHHLPVVTICKECNTNFSLDEQYAVTFLSCVLSGSSAPEQQSNASATRALTASPGLRAQIELSRTEYTTVGGEKRTLWKPDAERINRVVVKNARGHAYFECGEPMLDAPVHVWAIPLESMSSEQRSEFEGAGEDPGLAVWPEVGSRMMSRLVTGADMLDGWVIVQPHIYRYSVDESGGLRVRMVLWEYLATEVLWES